MSAEPPEPSLSSNQVLNFSLASTHINFFWNFLTLHSSGEVSSERRGKWINHLITYTVLFFHLTLHCKGRKFEANLDAIIRLINIGKLCGHCSVSLGVACLLAFNNRGSCTSCTHWSHLKNNSMSQVYKQRRFLPLARLFLDFASSFGWVCSEWFYSKPLNPPDGRDGYRELLEASVAF